MKDSNLTMGVLESAKALMEAVAPLPVIHFSVSVKDDMCIEGEWIDKALQCKPGQKGYIVPAQLREEVMRSGICFIEYQPVTTQEGARRPFPPKGRGEGMSEWIGSYSIFSSNCPTLDDYYEPYTYDYQSIFNAPVMETHGRMR